MLIDIRHIGSGYAAWPVSNNKAAEFMEDMIRNGAPMGTKTHLFLQSWENVVETFEDLIPAEAMKALEEGYRVTVRIDDWTFRHMLGYCAD